MDETGGRVVSPHQAMHRRLGKELFNPPWDLLDADDRGEDQALEMLTAAVASLYHWRQVGGTENLSVSDWQVARVFWELGHADPARRFARRSLEGATAGGLSPFYVGYGHEAMARAAALAGDFPAPDGHLGAARRLLAEIDDAAEAEMLAADLAANAERGPGAAS